MPWVTQPSQYQNHKAKWWCWSVSESKQEPNNNKRKIGCNACLAGINSFATTALGCWVSSDSPTGGISQSTYTLNVLYGFASPEGNQWLSSSNKTINLAGKISICSDLPSYATKSCTLRRYKGNICSFRFLKAPFDNMTCSPNTLIHPVSCMWHLLTPFPWQRANSYPNSRLQFKDSELSYIKT